PTQARFWLEWGSGLRYYDFNIWNYRQFTEKISYIHFNPVKRGLSRRTRRLGMEQLPCVGNGVMKAEWRSNVIGQPESGNERRGRFVLPSNCPTQAKTRFEWATRLTATTCWGFGRPVLSRSQRQQRISTQTYLAAWSTALLQWPLSSQA